MGLNELSAKLSEMLTVEKAQKRQKIAHGPTRHNRFGGTYVLEDWVNRLDKVKKRGVHAYAQYRKETKKSFINNRLDLLM